MSQSAHFLVSNSSLKLSDASHLRPSSPNSMQSHIEAYAVSFAGGFRMAFISVSRRSALLLWQSFTAAGIQQSGRAEPDS